MDRRTVCSLNCSVCKYPIFQNPKRYNKIKKICVGNGCGCEKNGGSPMCFRCWQRQREKWKDYYDPSLYEDIWIRYVRVSCLVCGKYINSSSKKNFSSFRKSKLMNLLCNTLFTNIVRMFYAQSSRPRVFPMLPMPQLQEPQLQERFFSKRIDRKMKCLSMTRKFFFKLMGISCESYIFKLGYTNPEFSHIYCGVFLRFILNRILARFYLLQ
jgi:hypothetical protein